MFGKITKQQVAHHFNRAKDSWGTPTIRPEASWGIWMRG